LQKFLKVLSEKNKRLAVKTTLVFILAFHDVEVEIPQPIFFYIEKISSVLESNFC